MKKLKVIITIALIIAIFSFFIGCQLVQGPNGAIGDPDNGETPTPTPTPEAIEDDVSTYLPIKVGNYWEYEGEGNEYASFTQEIIYGENGRFQMMNDNGGTVMANVIEVTQDSIVNTYREGEIYDKRNVLNKPSNLNIIILKRPLAVGNTWVSEENIYEIIKTDETVEVPAGTFDNCIVVRITFKDGNEGFAYYRKDVGLVRSDFVLGEAEIITSRLKAYRLN